MINYRVHFYTELHDRRIPNVGVGVGVRVGPVGFQLYQTSVWSSQWRVSCRRKNSSGDETTIESIQTTAMNGTGRLSVT